MRSLCCMLTAKKIFITVYDLVNHVHSELPPDQVMISSYQLGVLIIEWTSPLKAALASVLQRSLLDLYLRILCRGGLDTADGHNVHIDLAIDIVAALYDSDRNGMRHSSGSSMSNNDR
jgi:condensin complex subunit 3